MKLRNALRWLMLIALLSPVLAHAELRLTGLRLLGVDSSGAPNGSYWNTVGNDAGFNCYVFSGKPASPKFLNGGNTDDVLNPRLNLTPGAYTLGVAGDTHPVSGFRLELCFNDESQARISALVFDGKREFSGLTTYVVGNLSVTLTALESFAAGTDVVAAYEAKPNKSPDVGGMFTLVVRRTVDVPTATVTLTDFELTGDLKGDRASFLLTAVANVEGGRGGALELMSGAVALTEVDANAKWKLRADAGRYVADFERSGKFPVRIKFDAAVQQSGEWKSVDFRIAASPMQPVVLRGLAADTQFNFAGAARTERSGSNFVSHLAGDGLVRLAWKEARKETEGKLFFAGEMWSQLSVSPGLMRQVAWLDFKIMQGELNRVTLLLRGAGEVTRVAGDQVLAWNVEPGTEQGERRLVVQLNQPQKEAFALQLQMQTPLGEFPQTTEVMRLQPEGATRFAGYLRVVNEGAVRLEMAQASGLSQISPEQFPETDATRNLLRVTGQQRFAYRFSSADYSLRVQADQIQPELTVSELVTYHHGQNELAIEAELELDVREAPLRELLLLVPRGYALAKVTASGMTDYFLREPTDAAGPAELRVVYGQPVSGRQLVQLRLERNKSLGEPIWSLPRLDVAKAKSVRGNIGISADAGFRLTAERTSALTEMATAFFPRKIANLQTAFRVADAAWQATLRVERLPQTVQADVFHLFSIGEGVAYGSTVMNYVISGAPVAALHVELSDEYGNIEFTGKDVRNWQRTTNGYVVQLHSPVSGAYTLLATYERSFKPQGETLAFTGARPTDAQSESGHTLVISAYQFQVKPVDLSPGLLALETGEVPAEYRLFFDAPILAAYRYTARPFNLRLALSPLQQGKSLDQVVDRASLTTRISKEGQVLTDVSYLVKNRGNPNFRLKLPPGVELWAASVDGAAVVPVKDGDANLIPLPQRADANAVLKLELKLAAKSGAATQVNVAAPIVDAPVMLAEWKLEPDAGQRLTFENGSLTPVGGLVDASGFAQLSRLFTNGNASRAAMLALGVFGLLGATLVVWRWAVRDGGHRFSTRHSLGGLIGGVGLVLALVLGGRLLTMLDTIPTEASSALTFLAPVQQPGSALSVVVGNDTAKATTVGFVSGFLGLGALGVWILAWRAVGVTKAVAIIGGWTLLSWATLRLPNGAPGLLVVLGLFAFIHLVGPAVRHWWGVPKKLVTDTTSVTIAATSVLSGLLLFGANGRAHADSPAVVIRQNVPTSVAHEVRIDDEFAAVKTKLRWVVVKGEVLPLLDEPAVLTRFSSAKDAFRVVQVNGGGRGGQQIVAQRSGTFDVEVEYQLRVAKSAAENRITLATPCGLVNRAAVTVTRQDVDVFSPQAVSVQRDFTASNTVAQLVLSPVDGVSLGWKPRSRDVRREKVVFYVEVSQLYAPVAGVIEGVHQVAVRPAQGELTELVLTIPKGATVTDVTDNGRRREDATLNSDPRNRAAGGLVSLWRFDPDTRKLRVTLNRPQSRPFTLSVRSQVATGPLPFEQTVGLITVDQAANQIGVLGVATGNEVQLDSVTTQNLSAINLEDFPGDLASGLSEQIAGVTVRRAFRYSGTAAAATIKASAVEPDVRVETQDTVSLGEDRTVLAANATVNITRAGIFKLSFIMLPGFDVETISGVALSHWTESKNDGARVITLNLKGKTEGQQSFAINLAGPGTKSVRNWAVPQLVLREASKQQGTLLVVPEQGMQLQLAAADGLSQLDPQRSGVRQKGVLAFRILQTPWRLALDIEQVDPWIQVTSLQHATINEAQVKVAANLQYQIENTGLKTLRVWLPTNAENVRFGGEVIADFLRVPEARTNDLQQWEVRLQRRIIGAYLLQVNYQTLIGDAAAETVLRGLQAADVNLQRGYVTLQAGGRVQVGLAPTAALQPTEWQSIPRALQQNLQASAANYAFRLAEPSFRLPLQLVRHEAVKLLPARVHRVAMSSVISDAGVMLTQVRLEMTPGDKRLLHVKLPVGADYWFAFVNQNGVWPWREGEAILIPLEQQSRDGQPVPVEIFYSSQVGKPGRRKLDLQLVAPKFDLPLENISWRVSLNDQWQLQRWTGTLQLAEQDVVPVTATVDLVGYLQSEVAWQREKTQEAEQMLAFGNRALEQGEQQQARRAFQSAYGLSAHDYAFNEDARVQLHNLKLQQALVGLNVRQAANNGDVAALGGKFKDLRNAKELNFTQQDAKGIIDRNTADDNAATLRLAEKLIQQQDAAVSAAAAIRANIPEQGKVLLFQRAVAVDKEADLRVTLQAGAVRAAAEGMRLLVIVGVLVVFGLMLMGARWVRVSSPVIGK